MLAEAVITSTVVLTTLIGLYATFTKLYNAYNIRTTYFDIDGIYAIKGMIDHLIDNGEFNGIINDLKKMELEYFPKYIKLIDKGKYFNEEQDEYCNSLTELYNIDNMYIVKYEKEEVLKINKEEINQTFKDYLTYISTYYSFDLEEDGYNYLFIVEYKNGDKYYYSSLGVGWYNEKFK